MFGQIWLPPTKNKSLGKNIETIFFRKQTFISTRWTISLAFTQAGDVVAEAAEQVSCAENKPPKNSGNIHRKPMEVA